MKPLSPRPRGRNWSIHAARTGCPTKPRELKSPRQTPENEALRLECAALAETFTELLAERETLAHVVRPDLEAEYRLKLGALQVEVLAAECEVRPERDRGAIDGRGEDVGPVLLIVPLDFVLARC